MSDNTTPKEPEKLISCEACLKEIPESVAHSMEGEDYVHHFCGLDCYKKWQDENQKPENKK